MKPVIPLRFKGEDGYVIARDGLIVALFIPRSHVDIADAAGELFAAYQSWIGPEALQWIVASEELKPLTAARRKSLEKQLTRAGVRRPNHFAIVEGRPSEDEAPEFRFEYHGNEMKPDRPELTSSIELWFPGDFATVAGGLDVFVEKVVELAAGIPFASGYASLAFNYSEEHADEVEPAVTLPLAFRHPGLDIHATGITARQIGVRVRGAYWLTLLGPEALAELGMTPPQIRKQLSDPSIIVRDLERGVLIQAGDELRPGDINKGDNLPLTRKVAALLAPITLRQDYSVFGFGDEPLEPFLEWQRRHLD